jgi:uncharacterized protein
MPQTVAFFSALGLRQINFNADYSATWSREDTELLADVYDRIGDRFIAFYVERDPHFINLIDGKIAAILRGGYTTIERCRMGTGEFAFSPEGNIYPCERLVGDGTENRHCTGHIDSGLDLGKMSCHCAPDGAVNSECGSCSLAVYCMNWCGCSNYMATGYYNRVNRFLCASEKAAVRTAFRVFQTLEQALGPTFVDHMSGLPWSNSVFRQ